MNDLLQEWLKGRPPIIHELAAKFPPGSIVSIDGADHWVISYEENGSLGVSNIDPRIDYHSAVALRVYICAECLRKDCIAPEARELGIPIPNPNPKEKTE